MPLLVAYDTSCSIMFLYIASSSAKALNILLDNGADLTMTVLVTSTTSFSLLCPLIRELFKFSVEDRLRDLEGGRAWAAIQDSASELKPQRRWRRLRGLSS